MTSLPSYRHKTCREPAAPNSFCRTPTLNRSISPATISKMRITGNVSAAALLPVPIPDWSFCTCSEYRQAVRFAESFGLMTYASLRQPKSQPNTDAHAADAPVEIGGAKAPRDSSDRTLLVGTCALLLFAPLAFGAVEPWAVFLLEAASAALLMAWAFNELRSFQLSIALNPLFAPMLAFGLLVAFQLLFRQSAYHEATLSAALKYCAYAALCFLLHQCLTRTSYVRRLAATCCLYGLAI